MLPFMCEESLLTHQLSLMPIHDISKIMSCLQRHVKIEELECDLREGGSQECPNCGACKESVKHVLLDVHRMIPRKLILGTI